MAKKRTRQRAAPAPPPPPPPSRPSVTAERFRRLHRVLALLGTGPKTRATLVAAVKIDVRGFYRDLVLLREAGVAITLIEGRYVLEDELEEAVGKLPFPDPLLTLAEARKLSAGKGAAQTALATRIRALTT